MLATEQQAKEAARRLVARFDPEVTSEVDDLWDEYASGDQALGLSSITHGSGLNQFEITWALLLLPLAQAIVKKAVDVTGDAILKWLRERRGADHPDDVVVAKAVVKEFTDIDTSKPL